MPQKQHLGSLCKTAKAKFKQHKVKEKRHGVARPMIYLLRGPDVQRRRVVLVGDNIGSNDMKDKDNCSQRKGKSETGRGSYRAEVGW